jgi:hypothetical protein
MALPFFDVYRLRLGDLSKKLCKLLFSLQIQRLKKL